MRPSPGLPNDVETCEVEIAPNLAARLYRPPSTTLLPMLVYLHGGGWVDVLRDEGSTYAHKLARSGIAVTHLHAPDMNHNFVAIPATVGRFPQGDATLAQTAHWLRAVLTPSESNQAS